jgi:uncharacterized protein YpmS
MIIVQRTFHSRTLSLGEIINNYVENFPHNHELDIKILVLTNNYRGNIKLIG